MAVKTNPQTITPFTEVIGPVFPLTPLAARAPITTVNAITKGVLLPSMLTSSGKWLAAPIKKSIGIEKSVFVLEASPARAPAGPAAGSA